MTRTLSPNVSIQLSHTPQRAYHSYRRIADEEVHDIIDSDFNTESSDEEEEQEREAQQEDKAIAKQEREVGS